jgi:hypothetical protein
MSTPIAYAKTLASITGTMNNALFLNFAPGELLFRGATGDIVGEDPLLVFSFSASQNWNAVDVGNIPAISKLGHDALWFRYRTIKDSTSNLLMPEPIAAYAATVYPSADFTILKIGEP